MNKIYVMLELAGKLLQKIFKSRNVPRSESTKMADQVRESISMVDKGTAKIESQIAELKKIEAQLDAFEEAADAAKIEKATTPVLRELTGDSPLDEILADLAERAGTTTDAARKALVSRANEAYPPGDPKRMRLDDDITLEAYAQSKIQMGAKDELLEDVIDGFDGVSRTRSIYDEIAEDEMLPFGRSKESSKPKTPEGGSTLGTRDDLEFSKFSTDDDDLMSLIDKELGAIKQRNADLKAVEEKMADINNFKKMQDPKGLEKLMQEVQDEKVVDLADFKRKKKLDEDGFARGGRIGANSGLFAGKKIMEFLKKFGMDAPDKVADKKQIKNVIADPATDLERISSTPQTKMTIEDIRDMVQNDPRYDKLTRAEMDKVIIKETIRADLAHNMGMSAREARNIKDSTLEELYRDQYQSKFGMAHGGGVGTLFKRK